VWFLDLAPIQQPERVLGLAAQLLGLGDEPDRALLHTLCAHLRQKRVLFILDNCEHLIAACAELAFAIVQAAPWVHLLATSREGLHIPAERSYPVVALPLPAPGAPLQGLMQSPAVQLFVDRARQHQPAFAPEAADVTTLAQLVVRLEGIPLAIELAAARLRAMGLADILARLDDRFKLLSRGARGQQPRQQTLRALVDWSYELLTPDEQTLFMRLGVFVGGFDLAAAEAVCAAEPLCADDVLDLLSALVEKSLVLLDDAAAPTGPVSARYRLLETLRDYARERLAQAGAQQPTAQRHALHCLAFAKLVGPGLRGPEHAQWIRRTEQELGNLRAAMALALAGETDPLLAVKMAVPLQGFWLLRGHATEGRALLAAALALPAVQASDMAHAWALYVAAALAGSQSDHAQARQMLEECLLLRRRLGQPADLAATLSTLAWTRLQLGDAEGAAEGEREALAMFEQLGDVQGQAIGHLHLGQVALVQADDALARHHLQQAWALASSSGNPELQAESQLSLGMLAFDSGQPAAASAPLALALSVAQAADDTRGVALARWWLGRNQLALGQLDSAAEHLRFSLAALRQQEVWDALLGCLQDHARLAGLKGDAAAALRLLSACARARQRLGLWLPARQQQQLQALHAQLAHALGAPPQTADSVSDRHGDHSDHATAHASDYASVWAQGQGWDIDDAVQQARAA
jgi:predicted ATPase